MPWCAGSGDSSGGMRSSPAAPESLTSRSPARKQQPPAAPSVRPPRAAANGVTALLLQQRFAAEDFAGEGRSGARKGKLQAAHVKQLRPKGAVQGAAVAATTVSADMSPFRMHTVVHPPAPRLSRTECAVWLVCSCIVC